MFGVKGRSGERLELGTSAAPLLDALTRRLGRLTDELVVQPARPGPWTAFYRGPHLIALARPSPTGPGTSLDVASPGIAWATTMTKAADFDEAENKTQLRRAVEEAPESGLQSFAEITSGAGQGAIGALIAFGAIAVGLLDWVFRTRRERAVAAETGTQRELDILNAARRDVGRRTNSLTIGCLGAIVVGFVSLWAVIFIGGWLASLSPGLMPLAAALWLLPLVAALIVFASIRRRYPSPPRPRLEGRKILLLGAGAFIGALILLAGLVNR